MTARGVAARAAERASLIEAAGFVAAVLVAHVADPGLAPTRHTISEYANGSAGAVMDVGFASWAAALLACSGLVLLARARRSTQPLRLVVSMLLAVAATAVVLLDVFPTQTVAGRLPSGARWTTAGRLHDLGSGAATAAIACAALLSVALLREHRGYRRLVFALLTACALGSVVGLAVGKSVGGARQRLLVAAAIAWQTHFTRTLARPRDRAQSPRCASS